MGCRDRLAGALLLGRILWQLGYVRVAYGALIVERQCSWAVVMYASARGHSTGAVLGFGFMPVEISQCSSWTRLSSCPLRADSAGSRRAENCGVPQLQF